MRKIGFILAAAMVLVSGNAVCAGAQTVDLPDEIEEMAFSYSSGAGGWSTNLLFGDDGSFTGNYHDSEMGESGEEYPNGTIYSCSFSGHISPVEQVDDNCWKVKVDQLKCEEASETIKDDIRYVPSDPHGISEGDEMLLYSPGTPVSVLSDDMKFWAHVNTQEDPQAELTDWFLMSEKNDSGFVGYRAVSMINPWEDLTEEELQAESGLSFNVPDGAENVIYRYLKKDHLAEIQFTIGDDEFCARIQPAEEAENISGMYFEWDPEEEIRIGSCAGTIGQAKTGSEDWVELCQWYDADQGLQYSLSVSTTDIDGLDLTAVAEQIYKK